MANSTALTITGPSVGTVGGLSSFYKVTTNGDNPSTFTITPSDEGAGGSFTPNVMTVTAGSASSVTFRYTPSSTGTKNIVLTNTAGLVNPPGLPMLVTDTTQAVAVDDSNILWSPGNWDLLNPGELGVASKCRQTVCPGAYLKFRVNGTTAVKLNIDVSTFVAASTPAGSYPRIMWTTGNLALQTLQLTSTTSSLIIANELMAAADIQVWLIGTVTSLGDRWGTSSVSPMNILRISGIRVDPGATITSHSFVFPKRALAFGDGITGGARATGTAVQPADQGRSAAWFIQSGMGAEVGICAYSGSGWQVAGNGSVPAFPSHFGFLSSTRPRSLSGLDFIYEMHGLNGTNTQAVVQSWLSSARAALGPNTWIFCVANPGGKGTVEKSAAVTAYKLANPTDTKVAFIDLADIVPVLEYDGSNTSIPTQGSIDDTNPLEFAHALIAAGMCGKMSALMNSSLTTTTQLVVLGDINL